MLEKLSLSWASLLESLEEDSKVPLGTIEDGKVLGSVNLLFVMGDTVIGVAAILLGCLDLFFGLEVTGRGVLGTLEELSVVLLGTIGEEGGSRSVKFIFAAVESVIGVAAILLGCVDLFFGLGATEGGVLATLEELSKVVLETIGDEEGSASVKLIFAVVESVIGVAAIVLGCVDLFFGLGATEGGVLATLEELSKVVLETIGDEEGSGSVKLIFAVVESVIGVAAIVLGCVDLFFGLGATEGGVLGRLGEFSEVLLGTIVDGAGLGSVNLSFVVAETAVAVVAELICCVGLFGLGLTVGGVLATVFDSVNFFPCSLDETGGELFAALLCSGLSRDVKS